MKKILSLVIAFAMVAMTAMTAFADTASPYSIFGKDNREKVTSTSGTNYSICKIYTTYTDGSVSYGTGFLINSKKVVTAGHVIAPKGSSATPKTMTLYFGCNGTTNSGIKETVTCDSNHLYAPTQWKNNFSADYDYGAIKLDKAVSGPSSYFTLGTISSPVGKTISITGYEHHSYITGFTNWELLQSTGKITKESEYRLFTHVDGMPGQSGSPVVNTADNKVVGIYTYSASEYFMDDSSSENNGITRITTTVKNNIENF